MVKKAQESKSKTQDLANKAAKWLTLIALSIGLLTFIIWLLFNKGLSFSLERMVSVIVVACPHALGLAIPLVVAISTTISATKGLLIRDKKGFERSRLINTIVFDKTGTLTKGEFGVTNVVGFGYDKKNILLISASLEAGSTHPIAKGIIKEFKGKSLKKVTKFINMPGMGIGGVIDNKKFLLVGVNYLIKYKIIFKNKIIDELINQGKTIVYLLNKKKVIGVIALGDSIKDSSIKAINELKSLGIKCLMITGDNEQVAKWVSRKLGLDGFFANVLPNNKAKIIKKLQSKGSIIGMVGDGVNDAPALTQADVGIAIGAGTDVAIDSADIILVNSNPLDVVSIIKLSKITYSKMKQNLLWAHGYNLFAIPLAAGVLYNYGIILSPAIGAALMSLSTVIVAINAKLLKY